MFLRSFVASFVLATGGWVFSQPPELPPIGGKPTDPPAPSLPPISVPGKTNDPNSPARLQPPRANVGAADTELIEGVLAARRAYVNSLKSLHEHYRKMGDTRRMQMAEEELKQHHRALHPVYRLEFDVPSAKLQPQYNQREANELFRSAKSYKDRGFGAEYTDNQRRAEMLLQELLTKYPQSTAIVDAAYMLGELYESRSFRQFERAAAYFERSVDWAPTTPSDARMRAARLYDRELRDRAKAIELYRAVVDNDSSSSRRQEAQRRLTDLGAR